MTDTPQITTDRADGLYEVGQPVTFTVPEQLRGAPYKITWDGQQIIEESVVDGGEVQATIAEAGFVCLTVGGPDQPVAEAAAAVASEEITPTLPCPDDFDTFWEQQLGRLPVTVPPLVSEQHSEHEKGRVLKIAADTGNPDLGTVHGWLHVPKGEGPFPAVVRYHGAGVYQLPAENGTEWAERGWICLSINAHPIRNDEPRSYYEDRASGDLADYRIQGRDSRDTLYFVPMFLRAVHALNVLASLPEWNGTHLISEGHSQGGGQAIAAAGLHPRVTGLIASCPTHCDHAAPLVGRPAGWPKIVEWNDGMPVKEQLEATRYIDGVNFAHRIGVPSLFGVCFLDRACPPTGISAVYNTLTGPKEIHREPTIGHIYTEGFHEATFEWTARNFGPR